MFQWNTIKEFSVISTPIRIDVWSDFVCPWCFLASTSLEQLQQSHPVEIIWRAYELRPEGSPPMPEHYRQRIEESFPQLQQMARERFGVEIPTFRIGTDSRLAHIGFKFAEEQGHGEAYHRAVFRAHWQENKDIDKVEVLADIAVSVGLDREAFIAALQSEDHLQAVLGDIEQAQLMGLQGVPAIIFATKYLVSGAQPYSVLVGVAEEVQSRLAQA